MFTGIVQAVGTVAALERGRSGARLEVTGAARVLKRARLGSSIAVSGCCLTIVSKRGGRFRADLSRQTLARTGLGRLRPGDRVNLETPLRLGDELGGHMLQGHVEATGKLLGLDPESKTGRDGDGGWRLSVQIPRELEPYLAPQGTLAIEGISLTIASLEPGIARFAIIPYTHRHTNLRFLPVGAPVNLETDPIARHLERLLEARQSKGPAPLTVAALRRQGF